MIVLIRLFVFVSLLLIGSAPSAQEPSKAFFGIELKDITKEDAEVLGWEGPRGIKVVKPTDAGPAANAGILPGDEILSSDGRRHQIRRPFIFMRRSYSSVSSLNVGQRGLMIGPGFFGVGFIQGRELQAYRPSSAAWSSWEVSRSSRRWDHAGGPGSSEC